MNYSYSFLFLPLSEYIYIYLNVVFLPPCLFCLLFLLCSCPPDVLFAVPLPVLFFCQICMVCKPEFLACSYIIL